MQTIDNVNGFTVTNNYPDLDPEQKKQANENLLEQLYKILYTDHENNWHKSKTIYNRDIR